MLAANATLKSVADPQGSYAFLAIARVLNGEYSL